MIAVTKMEREALDRVGLLKYRRNGYRSQDQNFVVVNREHMSRDKKTFVVEEPEIMLFLGHYEGLNLQRIRPDQVKLLKEKGFLNDKNMQKWGDYISNAIAFQDVYGNWRVKKIANVMLTLGIWKSKSNKTVTIVDGKSTENEA